MGTPTQAEIFTQWANAVRILEQIDLFGRSNASNLIGMLDTLDQSLEGDYIDEIQAAARTIRNNIAGTISPGVAAAFQRPFLKQYCRSVIGRTNLSSDARMISEMYKHFVDNNERVESSVFTFGTPTANGANIGNGQIVRLNTDDRGFFIESQHIDAKRALCVADFQTGTQRGEEVFQLTGQAAARDELQRSGSGIETTLTAVSADKSLLFNASFNQRDGTDASPTSITNWTSSVTINSSNYSFDATNYFRASPAEGSSPKALNIKATARLSQKLSLRGTKLTYNRPYLLAVVWNRAVGSASGTLVCQMGTGASTSVSVSGQTGWNVTLVPATAGIGNWYRVFGADDMEIGLNWTRSGGNLLIDDVLFIPGTFFDGSWYWAVPASVATWTPHRVLDEFTWADQSSNAGLIQKWIYRAFGFYLPSGNGSGITFSDPA